ncbi:MAG TPA: hypothetical protein VF134_08870 [Candidatus Dormibacteraeota bacterium]
MAALAAGTSTASAWVEYCDWDPLVVVTTPAGNIVPVYDSVWTATPLNIGLPVETYTTERVYSSTGAPQTKVTMTVRTLPGLLGQFRVHDQVTTGLLGSGTVLAQAYGWSGQALTMSFVLDVA